VVAKAAFSNVQGVVIQRAGHWVMEENPADTVAAVTSFLQ
jgi:pimeloyl-ACP methyl ester carboxylesterase